MQREGIASAQPVSLTPDGSVPPVSVGAVFPVPTKTERLLDEVHTLAREVEAASLEEFTPTWVCGLPLAPFTCGDTLDCVDLLIAQRRPTYFITANLHYAMLTDREPRL